MARLIVKNTANGKELRMQSFTWKEGNTLVARFSQEQIRKVKTIIDGIGRGFSDRDRFALCEICEVRSGERVRAWFAGDILF